ncbi:hypothetical protein [Massilia glaciei]|uniref:DUF4148 domain-containing protein n=1 Tax=Massilia glaciei TaxID=1524097 RepID=A0A2U2I7B6_9BURK|nr:hypothetical protein [Massilia glaciei]PWF55638.1 hypothetical protein C7C56_000790 [Massilia glaciei]
MKKLACIVVGFMMPFSVNAADSVHDKSARAVALPQTMARSLVDAAMKEDALTPARERRVEIEGDRLPHQRDRRATAPMRDSRLAQAIRGAAKIGIVESSLEGYTEVLIQCQKATSPALTTALMQSDSQQDHCFRF